MVKTANLEVTQAIFAELIVALNNSIEKRGSVQVADIFMAVHNLHKYIVKDIAVKSHPNPPFEKTVMTARNTWLVAMKELRDQGR